MGRKDDDNDSAESPFARAYTRAGGRPFKVVDFPGLADAKVALWCPSDEEESDAEVEARKRLTGHYKMSALDLSLVQETRLFDRERDIELLTLVLRDPDEPEDAFFESSDEARKLTRPQREALIAMKDDYVRERFMARTAEQRAEIVRLVREMGKDETLSTWLASCEPDTMREIVCLLSQELNDGTPSTTPSSSTA